MPAPSHPNSVRLFRVAGIDVFLHWSWALVAVYQINNRAHTYSSIGWSIAEYLALFFIVLLHEFGHALACRQVGGKADKIMLWPLGGLAYISPPQRPGAVLWSIAAGPLVNVVLVLPLGVLYFLERTSGVGAASSDMGRFLLMILTINIFLLIFNLLPVYPLDGGQILRALLWYPFGRARSLFIVAIAGFAGVALLAAIAIYTHSIFTGFLTLFVFLRCLNGLKLARQLTAIDKLPRRTDFSCPSCNAAPPIGPIWTCHQCRAKIDPFETNATCPGCGAQFPLTQCVNCSTSHPIATWRPLPTTQV